jgi:periplasmic divalent cation tolerance protein
LADDAILVLTQMPDRASAQRLARALVESRLAACVSIGAPAESLYHWKGAIETAEEYPVTIKTRAARYPDVETQILALHPYELPEVVAVPVSHGLGPYLDWIASESSNR